MVLWTLDLINFNVAVFFSNFGDDRLRVHVLDIFAGSWEV